MAHKLDLSHDQITSTLGWKHDSEMPWHYLQGELSTAKNGLAYKLSDKISANDYSFMNDIIIKN